MEELKKLFSHLYKQDVVEGGSNDNLANKLGKPKWIWPTPNSKDFNAGDEGVCKNLWRRDNTFLSGKGKTKFKVSAGLFGAV